MGTSAKNHMPGLTFEVAFSDNMKVAASTWTDLTARLRSFDMTVGRDRELDEFRTGELNVVLDNTDRLLDPEYTSGPYYGGLIPMRQARLRAVWSSTTYDQFYGYIQGWPQSYPGQDADMLVNLQILDGFCVLASADLPDSVWTQYIRDQFDAGAFSGAWHRLGESTGTTMADSSGSGRHGTYAAPVVSNQPGILPYSGNDQALQFDGIDDSGIQTDPGLLGSVNSLAITFWATMPDEIPASGYMTMIRGDNGTDFVTIRLNPSGYIECSINGHSPDARSDNVAVAGRTYFIAVTYDGSTAPELWIDGVQQTATTTTDTTWRGTTKNAIYIGGIVGAGETSWRGKLDEVLLSIGGFLIPGTSIPALYEAGATPWDGDTSGDRLTNVLDAIGWPASLRDIDTGTSVLGPATLGGKAFGYIQRLHSTEAGLLHMTGTGKVRLVGRANFKTESAYNTSAATFGDIAGEQKVAEVVVDSSNVQHLTTIAKVSRDGGVEQRYEDVTASYIFGPRETTLSGLLMAGDGEAYDRAVYLVSSRKDPQFRVDGLVIYPGRDPSNLFPKVLSYELGQRLTVNRRPGGIGSAISKQVHIESITHSCDATAELWKTTYKLSPVDPNESSWAVVGSGAARNRVGTSKASY